MVQKLIDQMPIDLMVGRQIDRECMDRSVLRGQEVPPAIRADELIAGAAVELTPVLRLLVLPASVPELAKENGILLFAPWRLSSYWRSGSVVAVGDALSKAAIISPRLKASRCSSRYCWLILA